jgi:hypothetical protein
MSSIRVTTSMSRPMLASSKPCKNSVCSSTHVFFIHFLICFILEKERVVFADVVQKYNRRGKAEERDLIITDQALYIIVKEVKKKVVCALFVESIRGRSFTLFERLCTES